MIMANSHHAAQVLYPLFNTKQEEFYVITLRSDLTVIDTHMISRGTVNHVLVHPRDLFRQAITDNAYSVIIAHNHPSGNVSPTPEDLVLTKKLVKCGKLLEIPILDHIIFDSSKYHSFKENKEM